MNGRKAKLLRRIAKVSGRTDSYIKSTFKRMPPEQQEAYLAFMKENLKRIEETRSKQFVSTDQKVEAAHENV